MLSKKGVLRLNLTATERIRKPSNFRGLFYAMLSGVAFSLVSVIVKHMRNLHPGQLALYRFIATFIMCMPETVKSGQNPLAPQKFRIFIVLRGLCGGLNIFLNFIAFRYLGIGEASVIIFSAPVVVTIFARVFLKEPCSFLQSITVIVTVIGIIFTAKLPARFVETSIVYNREKIYGLLSAISSLFFLSAMQLLARKTRIVHPSISNLHFSWVGVVEIAILTAVFGNFQLLQCGIQSVYILLLALLSYTGLTLVVRALQCEYAGPISTARAAAEILLAFLFQIVIFHDVPDIYGIIGAILVLFCIILIGLNKWNTSSGGKLLSCEKFKCFSIGWN